MYASNQFQKMNFFVFFLCFVTLPPTTKTVSATPQFPWVSQNKIPKKESIHRMSKLLCRGCNGDSLVLFTHDLVRAAKGEFPLKWESNVEKHARWWAGQRKADCKLKHSFRENDLKVGENIFWGSGSGWRASDAVRAWAGEENYYTYATNACVDGQIVAIAVE